MPGPDYILDLSGLPRRQDASDASPSADAASLQGRPWLAIHWRCCGVYSRVYRNAAGTAYDARCPRCARALRIAVGEGGTDSRFFEAH